MERVTKKLITPFERLKPDGVILVINLVDPQINTIRVLKEAMEEKGLPYFVVGNKLDLVKDFEDLHKFFNTDIVYASMFTGAGLEGIEELIKKNFKPSSRILILGVFNSGKSSLISKLTRLELKIGKMLGTTMGYEEYPYENYTLIDSIGWLTDINKPLMISIDLSECSSISEKIERVFNEEIKGLENTLKKAQPTIERVVNVLKDAIDQGNKLVTVGAGASGLVAETLAGQAVETGVHAMTFTNQLTEAQPAYFAMGIGERSIGLVQYALLMINPGDVVIGISVSGSTGFVYHTLELARKKGAITVGITENPDSFLGEFSDYVIKSDAKPEGPSASKTMITHLAIAHSIVLTLASERGITADQSLGYMSPEGARV